MRDMIERVTRIERALSSPGTLKRSIGRTLVQQTRRRLLTEKTAPDGTPWAPWSPTYAITRGGKHSLLIDSGAMLNSIKATVRGASGSVAFVSIDSDLDYSAVNQKTRPFLGMSDENESEIQDIVGDWMERL